MEQVPAFACASPHSGTWLIIPERPSGALNDSLSMRCCPSSLVRSIVKSVYPPAWSVVDPATSDGLNGSGHAHALPSGPAVIWKLLVSNASSISGVLHGVKSAVDS